MGDALLVLLGTFCRDSPTDYTIPTSSEGTSDEKQTWDKRSRDSYKFTLGLIIFLTFIHLGNHMFLGIFQNFYCDDIMEYGWTRSFMHYKKPYYNIAHISCTHVVGGKAKEIQFVCLEVQHV